MVDVAAERGFGAATITRVVARSGVSRRTFYEHFKDREACFLAAFEDSMGRLAVPVAAAYGAPGAWPERVRAALAALLGALTRERHAGRVAVLEALGAGPAVLERRRHALAKVAAALDEDGRAVARGSPPPLTAEGVLGGVLSLIHARMSEPDGAPPFDALGSLVAMVLLPYLGPAAARRELTRPSPSGEGPPPARPSDPLRDLHMRLTYRTLRALLAVGELSDGATAGRVSAHPSNRAVADAAGIRDQGQVSKLLARLEQLGLVRNAVEERVKGEPNAWVLTERGEQVRATLSARMR
jgi:AcrR family transcriptional regulator